jgi:prepilin-type N-terminal cleavage/methylation domain-containing protein
MKTMQKMKRSAFTLVELLVVIVIIGILLAVLFPAISDALKTASANSMLQQGRSISQALLQRNLDENFDQQIYAVSTGGSNTFTTSTQYFRYLIKNGVIEGETFALFGGGGTKLYRGVDENKFTGQFNGWNAVVDVNTHPISTAPLLISRNLVITKLPDGAANSEDIASLIRNTTDQKLKFATTQLVIITKGGSGHAVHPVASLASGGAAKINPPYLDSGTPASKLLDVIQPGSD